MGKAGNGTKLSYESIGMVLSSLSLATAMHPQVRISLSLHCQTYGNLPSLRVSPPFDVDRYQVIVLRNNSSCSPKVTAQQCPGRTRAHDLGITVQCPTTSANILIQAFINTWLDYGNSLYFGIADGLMSRLQSVQNAATRLITGVRRCEHITPALRQLHRLPVRR